MTIDQLIPLTNGLSVSVCNQTLALDRARVTPVSEGSIEMAFRIAGTDFAPRFSLSYRLLASSSFDDFLRIVRRVAARAVGCRW
jgi:hypothetical protein